MKEEELIYGTRAVIEALESGKELDRILVQRGLSNELYNQLRKALRDRQVPLQVVPPEKLRRLCSGNHQGVLAYLTHVTYFSIEDVLTDLFESGQVPLLLVLDRVTDVRNFGAIARSAECAGVNALVIPSRGSAQISGDAIKTSAGALHRIKVCREDNLKQSLDYMKEYGMQIISIHEKTDTLIYDVNFTLPTALILGSEENGISGEYLKRSDRQAKIPMPGKTASLNVSVAAGIVLFEAVKQRLGIPAQSKGV